MLSYHTALKGQNCGVGEIVSKEEECKVALEKLGREYIGRTKSGERPAGCYWALTSSSREVYSHTYFNSVVDASATDPTNGREHGGICKTSQKTPSKGKF